MNKLDRKNRTCEISPEFIKESNLWYERKYVRFLMLPFMKDREISYTMKPKRNDNLVHCKKRTVTRDDYLESLLTTDVHVMLELFASTGVYDFTPLLHTGIKVSEKGEFFDNVEPEHFTLVFDIDGHGDTVEDKIKDTYRNTHKLAMYLRDSLIPCSIVFSGGKGFHIETNMTHPTIEESQEFAELISGSVPIDLAIYTKRREWRVPYSLHPATGLVVYPLSSKQFHVLGESPERISELRPSNLIQKTIILDDVNKLYNRGLVGFTH